MKKNYVLKGQICYSEGLDQIRMEENSYLVCEDGKSAGVFQELPERFQEFPLIDCDNKILIPGLVDLHIHAPQYSFRGLGMDMELLEWLNTHTFPEESKYQDLAYARDAYTIFAQALQSGATTRACIFATVHPKATELLMELMEATGLKTMVGKVNMDRNAPDYLTELDAERSVADTVQWLKDTRDRFANVKPILTPRFIPTCSDELMEQLHEVQMEYGLPVQSHLSENLGEIAWVKELCPKADFYGDAYDRFGMFGGDCKTLMAHCVSSGEEEQERMKVRGVYVAHCPQSNMNLSSGIAPVRRFLDLGIRVGLGSDVAGGHTDSMFRAISDAIQVSKLRWRLVDEDLKPLTVDEAFYLATKGGGEFFGKVGSFEAGYELDVLVLDDSRLKHPQPLTLRERLERLLYLADDREINGKIVAGIPVFGIDTRHG